MSADLVEDSKDALIEGKRANTLKGMRMRDEFICPITYALMREPMVASDGHTYEKQAIEKWLRTNSTSPRTGEPIERTLLPNLNLKKLITDILAEGGEGFYTKDMTNQERLFQFSPEKVIILKCLGPNDCEWNQQSFEVTSAGCLGGRKYNVDEGAQQREMMLFRDITVSRKHFEITQGPHPSGPGTSFFIRDLGSAGGTFIRILYGARKQLHPGMIILLGKHQFTVSSIDDGASFSAATGPTEVPSATVEPLKSLVENAERLLADISHAEHSGVPSSSSGDHDQLSARLKTLTMELSSHLHLQQQQQHHHTFAHAAHLASDDKNSPAVSPMPQGDFKDTVADSKHLRLDDKQDSEDVLNRTHHVLNTPPRTTTAASAAAASATTHMNADSKAFHFGEGDLSGHGSEHAGVKGGAATPLPHAVSSSASAATAVHHSFSARRCVLTCYAPDGSPLQGKSFSVGAAGGVLGRKQSNAVALLVKMTDASGDEKVLSVDSAISSEHARIELDRDTGAFYLYDGSSSKGSTNGTWFRLSGPHQESPPHSLQQGTEILIGSIRFGVQESMTIAERRIEDGTGAK